MVEFSHHILDALTSLDVLVLIRGLYGFGIAEFFVLCFLTL